MAHVITDIGVDLGQITDKAALTYYKREPGYTIDGVVVPPLGTHYGTGPSTPAWQALTVYTTGQLAADPSTGVLIRRITAGTSRATFDATEQALWTEADILTPAQLAANSAFTATFEALGRRSLALYDEFAGHANGAINGVNPLVGPAWFGTGPQPPAVTAGRLYSSGTGYAYQSFASRPAEVTSEIVWGGSGTDSVMTMALTDTSANVNNLCPHLNFGPSGFNMTCRRDGGTFDSLLFGTWDQPMLVDDTTVYRVSLRVKGNTAVVIGPNGEVFAVTDMRIGQFTGTYVFWEANTSTTVAKLISAGVLLSAPTGRISAVDPDLLRAGGGWAQGSAGELVANRDDFGEVRIGYDNGVPTITFGPQVVRTYLTASAAIGDASITTQRAIPFGSTIEIESGANSESVTSNADPNPLPGAGGPPFAHGLGSTLTKAHAAGSAVYATVAASQRVKIPWMILNGYIKLPKVILTAPGGTWLKDQNTEISGNAGVFSTAGSVGVGSGAIQSGQGATGARPTPAQAGPGSLWYDTTLHKPIWSDGANWRDATGAIV